MKSKPNIVYILADDMGYGDVSCLNAQSKIRTKNLDKISRGGMIFKDAHSSSAVCTPSRYSILAGRYNWRSRLKQGVLLGYSEPLIEPGRMTVASLLRGNGYKTACIGKWHLGWTWAKNGQAEEDVDFSRPIKDGPTSFGFDYFYGISASLDMPPYVYIENDKVTAIPDRIIPENKGKGYWREGAIAPDFNHAEVLPKLAEKAVRFIAASAGGQEPFFLYFALPAPHTPILPAPAFAGKSGTNEYGDFCLQVDHVAGQITEALERNGIAENTIVIFTADNGCSPSAGLEELALKGHRPSHVFRGQKADIYEGGHRIPLIVRWPREIAVGSESGETVCLADLMATCAELLGVRLPDNAGEDSISNLSVWRGCSTGATLREATVHHSIDGSFSIRQGRWKLELCPGSGGWSYPRPGKECENLPPIQLYDLDADSGERYNVFRENPEVVARLEGILSKYVLEGRSTPGSPQPNTGAPFWPQLEWLRAGRQIRPA
ncbi:MAG: arylsulfatase [Kiritimatiellia bacterium]